MCDYQLGKLEKQDQVNDEDIELFQGVRISHSVWRGRAMIICTKIVDELDHHEKLTYIQEKREMGIEKRVEDARVMMFKSVSKAKRRD